MPIRILIADDHEVVRMGLRALFAGRSGWQVCGEAEDGPSAVAKTTELLPDVVILDLSLPGMNGFDATIEIRRAVPSVRIILFSLHRVPVIAREVGADAFVSKSSGAAELLETIERTIAPSAHPLPGGSRDESVVS